VSCPGVRLDAYLDRELGPADRALVEGHIETCPACARELERIAAVSSAVRGWQPLPRAPSLRRAAAVLAAAALAILLLRGGEAPSRADDVLRLRADESVRHAGTRTYLAESLDREACIAVGDTKFAARHAFFRIEEKPMERRTKLAGGAVIATSIAVAIWWGTAEVTHRTGRTKKLGPGEHVVEEPQEEPASPRAPGTPPFDPATGFTGLVLDPQDRPVEGATIEVAASSEYVGRAPDAVAKSGPDGRFECGPVTGSGFFVSARKTGVGAAGKYGFPGPGADLVLRLVPGARLEGRVHEGDAPVPGVLLTAQMVGGQWAFARAVTDVDGRFVLEHLDPEEATLWGRPPEHEEFNVRPPLRIGETTTLDVPVARDAIFRGRVLDDETGAPVDLVAVRSRHNSERLARLLGDGWFEIPDAGRFGNTLSLEAKAYPETQVFYAPGEKEHIFRISRGRLVRVSVVDGGGRPVAGARVTAQPGWIQAHVQRGPGGTTDAAGRVDVRIPCTPSHPQQSLTPSNVEVAATRDGYCGPKVTAEVGEAREIDVTVRLDLAAAIEGQVVGPNGEPLGGALCSTGAETAYTGRDGRFRITSIPPGTVELAVSSETFASLRREGLELSGGETLSLGDLALGEGATVTGRVVDSLGNPVTRYKAWLRRGPVLFHGKLDARGGFTITGLDPGAVYEGGVLAGGVHEPLAQVPAGARDYVVTLKPAGGVEGRVTLADGGPPPIRLGVSCAAVDRHERADLPPSFKYFTDGTFRATLPAGRYRLGAWGDPWIVLEPADFEVAAGAVTRAAVLAKAGGRIEGNVRGRDPATRSIVVLRKAPVEKATPFSTQIRADGKFEFGPLEPGSYLLEAPIYKVGLRGTQQLVQVAHGETAACELMFVATGGLVVTGLKPGEEASLLHADGTRVAVEGMEFGQIAANLGGKPTDKEVAHAAAHADAQGVWRRFELIPGTYRMVRGGEATSVDIRGGETTSLDLSR
jgi:protocatechuate 3,4-dioxygenase beta subunit